MTHPADAVRSAVRRTLADQNWEQPHPVVLVACSGGPDSLALAAATARVAAGGRWRAGAVVVDHGLQADSDRVAARTAEQCAGLGLDPVVVRRVEVAPVGGPEAAARKARYDAFAEVAGQTAARAVLLGHTLDDQAETVLLGLARGSGARSLRGMAAASALPSANAHRPVLLLRPLLQLSRATIMQACRQWNLAPWRDPHNDDPSFTRVRVRQTVMPALVEALGPGVPQALARTAAQLRDDEEVLSQLAAQAHADLSPEHSCEALARLAPAVRRRVLRLSALAAGCPPAALNAGHLYTLDALVAAGREGGDVRLPGGVNATVRCGRLVLAAPTSSQE